MSGISFDKAQFDTPVAAACARCKTPLTSDYFALGPHAICGECRTFFLTVPGNPVGRVALATLLGSAAAAGGCLLHWAILEATGIAFGLIAIFVGLAVGRAVRFGSAERGGRGYQLLAIYLTYLSIGTSYILSFIPGLARETGALATALFVVFYAHAGPFLVFDPIGLVIIAFGLLQAWRMAASRVPKINGPYSIAHG